MILRHNQQIEKISSHALHGIGIGIETGVPFDQVKFMNVIEYPKKFRNESDLFIAEFPELFPHGIENGYLLKEIRDTDTQNYCGWGFSHHQARFPDALPRGTDG